MPVSVQTWAYMCLSVHSVKADSDGPYLEEEQPTYYSRTEHTQDDYQGTAVKAHSSYQQQDSPQGRSRTKQPVVISSCQQISVNCLDLVAD